MKTHVLLCIAFASTFAVDVHSVIAQQQYVQYYTYPPTYVTSQYVYGPRRMRTYSTPHAAVYAAPTSINYGVVTYGAVYSPQPYATVYGGNSSSPKLFAEAQPGPDISGSVPVGKTGPTFVQQDGTSTNTVVGGNAGQSTNSSFAQSLSNIDSGLSALLNKYNIKDTYTAGASGAPIADVSNSVSNAFSDASKANVGLTQAAVDKILAVLDSHKQTLPRQVKLQQIGSVLKAALGQLDDSALLGQAQPWLKLAFNLLNVFQSTQSGGVSPQASVGNVDTATVIEQLKSEFNKLVPVPEPPAPAPPVTYQPAAAPEQPAAAPEQPAQGAQQPAQGGRSKPAQ